MSQSHYPNNEYYNAESFSEYLQTFKKNGNEKKVEFAKKIFIETYHECIKEGRDSHDALQKAIKVAFGFLIKQ